MRRLLALGAVLAVVAAGTAGSAAAAASPAQVVRAWSKALNRNDNAAAARLFAKNAWVVQPPLQGRLTSFAVAVQFNDSLPCAGKVERIKVKGTHATAVFLLGHRPRHTCNAPGQEAAAVFVVVRGKITVWAQVPVPNDPSSA